MKTLLSLLLSVLIFQSCAHKPKLPPPAISFMQETKSLLKSGSGEIDNYTHLNMEQKWARIYLHGKTLVEKKQPALACLKFRALEETPFPLPSLVDIQILKVCPISVIEARKRMDYPKHEVNSWAREDFLMAALRRSKEFGLIDHQAKFLGELAFYQKTHEQKVRYLSKAIKMAKDKNLIGKLEEKLYILSPMHIEKPKPEEFYKVARDLERFRKFKEARRYYELIISDPKREFKEVVDAHYRTAMTHKIERDKRTFRKVIATLVTYIDGEFKKSPGNEQIQKAWHEYHVLLARSLWTENSRKSAHAVLDTILKESGATGDQIAHAYWLKGAIYSEENKFKSALSNYKAAFDQKIEGSDILLKVSWAYSWTLYLKKDYKNAVEAFDKSISLIDDPLDKLRYEFWLAKSLWRNNNKTRARDIFDTLATKSSQNYYGILARAELKKPFPKSQQPANNLAEDFTIMWLNALEEYTIGKSYLEEKVGQLTNDLDKLGYLPYFSSIGWFEGGLKTYFSIPSESRYKLADTYLPLVFPTPYKDLVSEASKKFKVSSSFIYSIMRQESAFDPDARSWADAFGLLQLTPERAVELQTRAGVPYKIYSDLYDPKTNIYLGARLLKDLQIKFKNRFIEYVSSYNATESAVNHWKKTRFRGDFIEFIERIPYDETRTYVKLVLRNYINYKRNLSEKPFHFPQRFFTRGLTD